MTSANYDIRSSDLLHAMSWKNLNDRFKINKAFLVYKIMNGHSAPNLKDKFIRKESELNTHNLRIYLLNYKKNLGYLELPS